MKESLPILLTVLGGLGIFLLGMKHLSEGLQATAGGGLRKFMANATKHRIIGVFSGIVSTIIVQSSSIITVMVVGFVSSGLMNLSQAINVIIGSNIGTTATAWLIGAIVPELLRCVLQLAGELPELAGYLAGVLQDGSLLHKLQAAGLPDARLLAELSALNPGSPGRICSLV